ncbi:MAG: UPF0182 family protein [Theionarchaea archaeon]|nr:MAG: hypothetical protein AYK19_02535 [Theionarchaea archaeon DG-70-1]MBU7027551.1 UPF0182 family protein [Theionarchaea archaeon]
MKSKIVTILVLVVLLSSLVSVLTGQTIEQRIEAQQELIQFYNNHFSTLCGSIFLVLFFIFIIVLYWMKRREPHVSQYGAFVYLISALLIMLALVNLWGTLTWAWDLPSQYFGDFYWINMKLAAVGGLILSFIAFFPLFSRESIIYTVYSLLTRKQKSYLPEPAPLWFFIPWTLLKLLFGMWLFSNMLVGLWILGGNTLTLFSKDTTTLYAELLVIGPLIAGVMKVRLFLYCLHQLTGAVQYIGEGLKRMLTHDELETIWGKIMKIFGIIFIFWSASSLFGITGAYESLVGPYRHDLFSSMVKFGAGIGCMLVGGFFIGDTKREKVYHIVSALLFTGAATALAVYYSPDIRVLTGFFIGIVTFPVVYILLWRRLLESAKGTDFYKRLRESVSLTAVSTLAVIAALVVALVIGSVGSGIWLKPQHRRDPLSINADLIALELELNALSAGLDFNEIQWNFPLETEIDNIEMIESLIEENDETFKIVRLWDAPHAKIRFKPSVGLRWMEMGDTDIVRFTVDGELKQFWISPKNLYLEEILRGSENAWYNEHKVYTHSVGYIVADALTGKFENWEWTNNNIYFGEGMYRDFIYDFKPHELQGEYTGPTVNPRIPLRSVFTKELTFYTGETVAYMNIFERASELFPWLYMDPDPYLCVNNDEIWYSMDLGAFIQPSKIPLVKAPYIRPLLKLLIHTETGEYRVYYDDTSNDTVLLPLLTKVYSNKITPLSQAPDWYIQQLRYPEVFMELQVKAMNVYHVQQSTYTKSKVSVYVHEEDFFEIPAGEDLRHVLQTFFGEPEFVSMITVEFSGKKVPNIAAIWVTQNDYPHYGRTTLIRVPSEAYEEIRVIGMSVVPNALTADEEVSYWNKTQEGADTGNILFYKMGDRVYYFVPFYTGREKTVTLQQVACVMALTGSEAESRKVGFGDDVITAFRNLQLEILASKISGRDIGTYSEAMDVLAGETIEGENISEIISQMNWVLEQREAALAQGNEVEAAQLLEEFFELFKKLAELTRGQE